MAKREQMLRLMYISNFLKSKGKTGATYEDIKKHLENKDYDTDLAFSEKTFKRDRNLLFEIFEIETQFKRSTMTYQIINDENIGTSQGIFENLMLINAYKQTENQSNVMLFEKRLASGFHNLKGIIYAIKNCKTITFHYNKYWETMPMKKVLQPYALKEFRNRWYLLGNEDDGKEFSIKIYGLDRITHFKKPKKTFTKKEIDIEALFVNSFGIVSTLDKIPETIILSFNQRQSGFVKSLPIHHSQKIMIDNADEFRIELTLVPTYDFYQELLTHAERLKIIEPEEVKNHYLNLLINAQKMNN